MPQVWEYQIGYNLTLDHLKNWGTSGWELVAVVIPHLGTPVFYFKRPKGY